MSQKPYAKKLPLIIRMQDHDDRKASVLITIEVHHASAPQQRKELVIRLTDEEDLFFLFTLRISEEDFQGLKIQQGIRVDFAAFPQEFIDRLESCLKEDNKDGLAYSLELACNGSSLSCSANLNIIQTSQFQCLPILSLKFLPGSDSDVKRYLAECLKTSKEQTARLQKHSECTEADLRSQLQRSNETLRSQSEEMHTLKSEWTARINELKSIHWQELNTEKEKALQIQSNLQQKYEINRKEFENENLEVAKRLQGQNADYDKISKEFYEFRMKSEKLIHQLETKLNYAEEENVKLNQEAQTLRKENAILVSERHENEKTIASMTTKIAVLEQEAKSKEEIVKNANDLRTADNNVLRKLQEELEQKKQEIVKLINARKSLTAEVEKGVGIIRDLRAQAESKDYKVQIRFRAFQKQEILLKEKQKELEDLQQEAEKLKTTLNRKEEENKQLSNQYETVLHKLSESKDIIATNENVIAYLNKQVTEVQLSKSNAGQNSSAAFHPSSRVQNTFGGIPSTSYNQSLQQSTFSSMPLTSYNQSYKPVQYQNLDKNVLPAASVTLNKCSPVNNRMLNEQRTVNNSSPAFVNQAKTNEPFMDPKYLQPVDGGTQSLYTGKTISPSSHLPSQNPGRQGIEMTATAPNLQNFTKREIAPGRNGEKSNVPLTSYYFPTKSS